MKLSVPSSRIAGYCTETDARFEISQIEGVNRDNKNLVEGGVELTNGRRMCVRVNQSELSVHVISV